MPHLSGAGAAIGHTVLSSRTSAEHALGAKYETKDGRTYRYVKAGATLVVGNMLQGPAENTDHDTLTVAADAAQGATQVTLTMGATGVTANDYGGGYLLVDTTPGLGYAYRISSHPTAANAAPCVITLEPEDGLQVALTAAGSKCTLVRNPYNGVIQTPITTLTGACVGAAVYPIPSGEYGWIQSGGVTSVLIAGTPGVGQAVVVPGTVAGCVVVDGATAPTDVVGRMLVTGVAGKCLPVALTID